MTAIQGRQFSIRKAKLLIHPRLHRERTVVHADEAATWDDLHERFEVKGINHQEAYSLDGACTHMAEEYVSRLRRAEIGIHRHIAGAHLLRYAQESSWRARASSVGDQGLAERLSGLELDHLKLLPVLRPIRVAAANLCF